MLAAFCNSLSRPFARLQYAEPSAEELSVVPGLGTRLRLLRSEDGGLKAAYSCYRWQRETLAGQQLGVACTWCGFPTHSVCEYCQGTHVGNMRPDAALCAGCQRDLDGCRVCIEGASSPRTPQIRHVDTVFARCYDPRAMARVNEIMASLDASR